jgi:phage-related holin
MDTNIDITHLAQLLYTAAMHGEWRMLFAVLLLLSVAGGRWVAKNYRPQLEASQMYRDVILPALPVLASIAASVGVDTLAGKPFAASVWRALGIGLAAGGAYKVWRAARVAGAAALARVRK